MGIYFKFYGQRWLLPFKYVCHHIHFFFYLFTCLVFVSPTTLWILFSLQNVTFILISQGLAYGGYHYRFLKYSNSQCYLLSLITYSIQMITLLSKAILFNKQTQFCYPYIKHRYLVGAVGITIVNLRCSRHIQHESIMQG